MSAALKRFLFWLYLTSVVIVPMSNDVFISAFPIMKVVFNTTHIGLVISVFLSGLADLNFFMDRYLIVMEGSLCCWVVYVFLYWGAGFH